MVAGPAATSSVRMGSPWELLSEESLHATRRLLGGAARRANRARCGRARGPQRVRAELTRHPLIGLSLHELDGHDAVITDGHRRLEALVRLAALADRVAFFVDVIIRA